MTEPRDRVLVIDDEWSIRDVLTGILQAEGFEVVTASDGESIPVLTTSALPRGAVFVDSGNGSATFDWLHEFTQAGVHNVTFYATDDSSAVGSDSVTIIVRESVNSQE